MNINENLKLGKMIKKHTMHKQISATNHHQITIVACFISSVIQFDNSVHPVVSLNYLICMFINIYENLKNEGENHQLNYYPRG